MLKKLFIRFLIIILILSISLILIEQVVLNFNPNLISVTFPWLVLLFLTTSSSFHYVILKSAQENARKFVNKFLISTTLKLLIYLSTLLIVIYLFDVINRTFILNFAVVYLLYTTSEVLIILKQLKKINSNKLNNTLLNDSTENIEK